MMLPPAKEGKGLLTKPKLEEAERVLQEGMQPLCTLISTPGSRTGRMGMWCLKLPNVWPLVLAALRHKGPRAPRCWKEAACGEGGTGCREGLAQHS